MSDLVSINHGSGGKLAHEFIRNMFVMKFGIKEPLTDSAIMNNNGMQIAFTTDSYVVNPVFFPGGDIGKLAVCGTVNDLAVSGAVPAYISVSFIIEEGFAISDLERIIESMAAEAENANVDIVTGDTKVVEKGFCDKLFITTAGVGFLKSENEHISTGKLIKKHDRLIVNGSLGNHSIAVLGARNNLSFSSPVLSDCASLNHLISSVTNQCRQIHFMRDLTRGGLAAVLYELAGLSDAMIEVDEELIPVEEPVRGLCEVMGFDPLYLANEGKVLIVAGEEEFEKVISVMHSHPLGKGACTIGRLSFTGKNSVIINTKNGGRRNLDIPYGIQLPRIC